MLSRMQILEEKLFGREEVEVENDLNNSVFTISKELTPVKEKTSAEKNLKIKPEETKSPDNTQQVYESAFNESQGTVTLKTE